MRDINQKIIKFNYEKNFNNDDFYISKSNKHIFDFLKSWPKWEKNFINIIGENFSGKTHLIDIFLKNFKGIKLEASLLNNETLKEIKVHQNIIIENLNKDIDEKLAYTLFNIVDQDNKYLITTSTKPIVDIEFILPDLISRTKNFLLLGIEKPDDELIFALIIKNLSAKSWVNNIQISERKILETKINELLSIDLSQI